MDSIFRIHNNSDEFMVMHESKKINHFHEDLSFLHEGIFAFFFPLSFSLISRPPRFFPPSDFIIGIGLMADSGSGDQVFLTRLRDE